MLNNKNKKGQVGESVTWFIATIAIILILMFFTFGASYLAKAKSIFSYGEFVFSKSVYMGDDIYLKKTIYSELMTKKEDAFIIGRYINSRNKRGEFEIKIDVIIKKIIGNFNKR